MRDLAKANVHRQQAQEPRSSMQHQSRHMMDDGTSALGSVWGANEVRPQKVDKDEAESGG